MLTINEIKILLEVVNAGSITGASKNLFISQPAVSQHVKTIEEKLGVKLFERANNALYLTDSGFSIYKELEALSRRFDDTMDRLLVLRETGSSSLKVCASKTIGNYLLPALIHEYVKNRKTAKIYMDIGNTSDVIEKVLNGEVSIGFVEAPMYHATLETEGFYIDRMKIICSPENQICKGKTTIEEILGEPFIMREKGSGTRKIIEKAFARKGLTPDVKMIISSNEAIKKLVMRNAGISILSELVFRTEEMKGLVRSFEIDGLEFQRSFFMVKNKDKIPSEIENDFKEFVRTRASVRV